MLLSRLHFGLFALVALAADAVLAAAPTVEDALKQAPVQEGIEYDRPSAEDAKACKIELEKGDGGAAWVVRSADGIILRKFSDSNRDNAVDVWAYYRNGLEVYRDIDANFNGKADNYRWFHTAGARWGIDTNEDGKLDAWKTITAEEAAEELVAALGAKDAARFARLTVTKEDVAKLGLSKTQAEALAKRVAEAPAAFKKLADESKIDAKAEFTDFGGIRPGAVPAGTQGSTKDLLVYEDVWAMVHVGDHHDQLQLGSMVLVDNCWKFIDAPTLNDGAKVARGFFYDARGGAPPAAAQAISATTDEMQKILEAIEQVDRQFAAANDSQKPALSAKRADLIERLAGAATNPAERDQWTMQLADMLNAAALDGSYPAGLERLQKLEKKLAAAKASEAILTHVEFRRMQAAWGISMSDPKADPAKVQETWLKQLEDFVSKHKTGEHVAEALYQLAMANEYPPGSIESAQKWYQRLATEFPNSMYAPKARGAIRRISIVGKPIALKGAGLQGGEVDLARYKNKIVLVHYWSTSVPATRDDHERLLELHSKYGGEKFDVVGVCLDSSRDAALAYLNTQKLPWKHIFEPGGFDSRLANEMGIITLPLMILVDEKGQAVNNNVMTAELEAELKKLIPSRVAAAK